MTSFYFGYENPIAKEYDDSELKKTDSYLKSGIAVLNTETSSLKQKVQTLENEKLSADGSISLVDDLDMGNNAIIGIEDINAQNSVPSKKYVNDEDTKQNTKILKNTNDISSLKNIILYSHMDKFIYQNPVSGVFKGPHISPAGFSDHIHFFSTDYNEKTNVRLLGFVVDSDSTITGSSLSASVEIKLFNNLGGYRSKSIFTNRNIANDRINTNQFQFSDEIKFNLKNEFPSHYTLFCSFQLKIAVPWNGNETCLYYCVDYF